MVHKKQHPKNPTRVQKPIPTKAPSPISSTHPGPSDILFQPTLPEGPMPSSELILSLVNASAFALHKVYNESEYNCWLCYSAAPPFL